MHLHGTRPASFEYVPMVIFITINNNKSIKISYRFNKYALHSLDIKCYDVTRKNAHANVLDTCSCYL